MPEMVKMHLTSRPKPLREVSPTVSAAVADAVMRALEVDPALRPPAGELGDALRAAVG
jgi:hypothetical protein